MGDLHVHVGTAARDALCQAFDDARHSIDAEFYSLADPKVIASLNHAAEVNQVAVTVRIEANPERHEHGNLPPGDVHCSEQTMRDIRDLSTSVNIIFENDPTSLLHAKAVVVDENRAFIETSNPRSPAYDSAGAFIVEDDAAGDVLALRRAMDGEIGWSDTRVSAGVASDLRSKIYRLLGSDRNLDIAVEDLTDTAVVDRLIQRHKDGRRDRIVVGAHVGTSDRTLQAAHRLARAKVRVRVLPGSYMHAKFIDDGRSMYVGSANLTYSGLDTANEAGIVAPAADFGKAGEKLLRSAFTTLWADAKKPPAKA